MEHQYHHLEDIFPEAGLPPFVFPTPADWPPNLSPPPQLAAAPSVPPQTSATRRHSTAPGRQGPELNLPTRSQASHGSKQGPKVRSKEKANGRTCETCGKTFKLPKDLTRHIKTIHPSKNDKPFVCYCGKEDYRLDNLKRHMETCKCADKTAAFVCRQGHKYHS